MKYLTPVVTLLLMACTPDSRSGTDGYQFGQPQYTNHNLKIEIIEHRSRYELRQAAKQNGIFNEDVAAFSTISRSDSSRCTIHILDPHTSYEPEFIGHELVHCIHGQWHTNNESRS